MQHYNLYKTLELDPSASSELLVDELTQRLDSGLTSNPGGEEELRLAREMSFDVKRWWPIAAVVAGVLVIALVVPQLVGAGLGSSGPEKLANEIAQLDEDDRADWMNQHAAAGRAALLENKLENTSIGSSDDAEYAAGESYTEVKNKDVHATSVNTQLFLFARDGGDWKLYDIFD